MSTQIDVTALRRAAVLYVVLVVTGIFGSFVPQSLVVSGDAVVTVHKLLASETLFRLTVVGNLVAAVSFVFLARELYRLLRAVDKSLASLMVTLVLASIPISFLGALTQVAALRLIHGGPELAGLSSGELHSLAMLFIGWGDDVSSLNSVFFGLWLLPFGGLIIKSGFIPRVVGYLVLIAGVSYLVGSLNFLLAPSFSKAVSSVVTIGYLGELAAVVWLVVAALRSPIRTALQTRPLEVQQP